MGRRFESCRAHQEPFWGHWIGPVLALVSGAHGTEYTSIIAIEKLINLLDPSQIAGTVILVPLVNIQSFEQKVPHVNPIDNKSMKPLLPWESRWDAN